MALTKWGEVDGPQKPSNVGVKIVGKIDPKLINPSYYYLCRFCGTKHRTAWKAHTCDCIDFNLEGGVEIL